MENKVLKGIVVCAFKVVKGTDEPLKTPYGFIHPESDESFEALLAGTKPIGPHIHSIAKDENIQFVLRSCKLEAAKIACGNNDEVNKGDLVTFTYHTDSANGFPQARDVKLVKAYWRPTPSEKAEIEAVDDVTDSLISAMPKEQQPKYRNAQEAMGPVTQEEIDQEEEESYDEGNGLPNAYVSPEDYDDDYDYDDRQSRKDKRAKKHQKRHRYEEEDE